MNLQTRMRKQIIEKIRNTVKKESKENRGVSYKDLIARICIHHCVSERKAKEYVKLLIDFGDFFLFESMLYFNEELKGGDSQDGEQPRDQKT